MDKGRLGAIQRLGSLTGLDLPRTPYSGPEIGSVPRLRDAGLWRDVSKQTCTSYKREIQRRNRIPSARLSHHCTDCEYCGSNTAFVYLPLTGSVRSSLP